MFEMSGTIDIQETIETSDPDPDPGQGQGQGQDHRPDRDLQWQGVDPYQDQITDPDLGLDPGTDRDLEADQKLAHPLVTSSALVLHAHDPLKKQHQKNSE